MKDLWYFSKDQIRNSPNRKFCNDPYKELGLKLKTITFTQLIGQKLNLSQHCICTAIVYIHRFYVFFTFEDLDMRMISMVTIFIATKSQNEYRRLEHVIKATYHSLDKKSPALDVNSKLYIMVKKDLICLENIFLQFLGFIVDVEHPHPYIVKICQLVKGSEELSKKSYLLATASIMSSTMCLEYKPAIVACACVNLGARWSQVEIGSGPAGRSWFYYVDPTLSEDFLEDLTDDLGHTILKCISASNSPVFKCVITDIAVKRPLSASEENLFEDDNDAGKPPKLPATFSSTNSPNPIGILKENSTKIGNNNKTPKEVPDAVPSLTNLLTPFRISEDISLGNGNKEKLSQVPAVVKSSKNLSNPARNDVKSIMVKVPRNLVVLK